MAAVPRSHRAVLFANAHSGRSRRWLFPLLRECERQSIELTGVHFDLTPERIQSALEDARASGVRAALAAGGDGTVGSVAQCVVGGEFILGVLPAGTSNDFARSLLIPMSVQGAVRVIAEGAATRVDVGDIGGHIFCHAAVLGLNSDFAIRAQRLRRFLGRASYPTAALAAYRARRPVHVDLSTERGSHSFDALEVAIINAPVYGGALELEIAESELTDRQLQVMIIEDLRLRTVIRALPDVILTKRLRIPGSVPFPIRKARLTTPRPLPVTVDGEVKLTTPTTVRVRPSALKVFAPRAFIDSADVRPA